MENDEVMKVIGGGACWKIRDGQGRIYLQGFGGISPHKDLIIFYKYMDIIYILPIILLCLTLH